MKLRGPRAAVEGPGGFTDRLEDYETLWLLRKRLTAAEASGKAKSATLARARTAFQLVEKVAGNLSYPHVLEVKPGRMWMYAQDVVARALNEADFVPGSAPKR